MGKTAPLRIAPKQSLGQNFLADDNIARNIVRDLHLTPEDVVLEIGPGQGALTKHLVPQVKHLIAIEIDKRVVRTLEEQFAPAQMSLFQQDFLEVRLGELSHQYGVRLRIVGNIPYHLTSPILFKIFEEYRSVRDVTVMMQREVARRVVGKPGTKEYGILSLFSQLYGVPRLFFNVSPNCFYPKPKVVSTVVGIEIRDSLPEDVDITLFSTVVRTTFGKRRKTLRNCLKYLPCEESVLRRLNSETGIALDRRPEELTVDEFITLTKDIQRIIHDARSTRY